MDQVTKKEVAEHIQELFDAIEDPRPIDVIKDPSIIRDSIHRNPKIILFNCLEPSQKFLIIC